MAKYSRRRWKIDDDGMHIVDHDGKVVCQLGDYGEIKPWRAYPNAKANGPLIAAAPCLLETAQHALTAMEAAVEAGLHGFTDAEKDDIVANHSVCQMLRDAIDRATEQPNV